MGLIYEVDIMNVNALIKSFVKIFTISGDIGELAYRLVTLKFGSILIKGEVFLYCMIQR